VLRQLGGRALAPVDLHVTLSFLGAVGEAQLTALRERAGRIEAASFELAFEHLEWWRAARILAASVAQVPATGTELAAALAGAAQQVGLAPELAAWRPHVTLARGVTAQHLPASLASDTWPVPRLALPVTRFYLAQSQGLGAQVAGSAEAPRYATLASWPLRPQG
jgi:2'-5' RNA ligase